MKKLKSVIMFLVLMLVALTAAACSNEATLAAPKSLYLTIEDYSVGWSEVDSARGYIVEVTSVATGEALQDETRRTSYSLSSLSEGSYEVRVMAVGGRQNSVKSAWSEPLAVEKGYESGCAYSLINNNSEYELVGGGTASGTFVIEDVYRGKPVTSIGTGAFRGNAGGKLVNVTIGSNVKTINETAFYQCINLEAIVIPDSVTSIGDSAFLGCKKLTKVTLPANITEVADNTFSYCNALEEVVFGEKILTIGEGAFYTCSALKNVVLPDSVQIVYSDAFGSDEALTSVTFGTGLTSIYEGAFSGCTSLAEINFADSGNLSYLGSSVFSGTAITSVALPDGVEQIGSKCFGSCSNLAEVSVPESVISVGTNCFDGTALYANQQEDGYIYADKWLVGITDDAKQKLVYLVESDAAIDTELNSIAAKEEKGIAPSEEKTAAKAEGGTVTLKNDTFGVATALFYRCPQLVSVKLPASIKYLCAYAFYYNENLQSFAMTSGSKLISIGQDAFAYCKLLTSVTLLEGLEEIDVQAFYQCEQLGGGEIFKERHRDFIPSTVNRIGTYAFNETGFFSETDQYGVVYVGNWVVGYTDAISNTPDVVLSVPGSVSDDDNEIGGIANYAFVNCTDLKSVTGLGKVLKLGVGAFYKCTALSVANLNEDITEIKPYTFSGCTSLFSVEFPGELETVGNYAFYGCSGLSALDFSKTNLKSIGNFAFANCSNLKTADFGTTVESIGAYAFFKCTSLGGTGTNSGDIFDVWDIYSGETETDSESSSSETTTEEPTPVVLPDSLTYLGMAAFARCEGLVTLKIGSGLTEIPAQAFRNCSSLKSIEIPSNIKTIGDYAFFRCSAADEITIGENVESIGDKAFAYDTSLKTLVLPQSVKTVGVQAFRGCEALTYVAILGTEKTFGTHAFFNDTTMTVYAEATEEESQNWGGAWNTSYRPIRWGCVFEGEGSAAYVVSVSDKVSYQYAWGGLANPVREGYIFGGWTTNEDGTLTAVWLENIIEE